MPAKFGLNSIDGDKQRQQVAKYVADLVTLADQTLAEGILLWL